ncbi:HesA/MoeB/ThiF family protein [Shewanella sp. MF05960]|uniref:HesA/MoeB/ThiF family protein n=1 Tax=Shewanella sp. MF05960 TaxID=3434874 RepID=UPI003D78DBCD
MKALTDKQYRQYSRTMLLNDIGETGLLAIINSQVAIIGLGGLGQLVVQYLAAAGVKHFMLVDHDVVALDNLPRQLLYSEADIGQHKVSVAKRTLSRLYSDVYVNAITDKLTETNVIEFTKYLDTDTLVFDCTDNLVARHVINQLCVTQGLTLISAAISAYQGQLFCIDFGAKLTHEKQYGCYRCLYPEDIDIKQTCSQQGVLGPAVGVMASMQALVGLQHICNTFTQYGILQRFDALTLQWHQAKMNRDLQCTLCQQPQLQEYANEC